MCVLIRAVNVIAFTSAAAAAATAVVVDVVVIAFLNAVIIKITFFFCEISLVLLVSVRISKFVVEPFSF